MTSSNPFDVINQNEPTQNYEEFTGSNPFDVIQQREAEENTQKLKIAYFLLVREKRFRYGIQHFLKNLGLTQEKNQT